jgi:two-component system, OmpR family, phosphate regulon sensor histidine kinase PhoR
LKPLKESAIASKVLNKLKDNLSFAWIYFPYVFSTAAVVLIILSFLLDVDLKLFSYLLIVVFLLSLFVIYFLGRIRKKELSKIKEIIGAIRNNDFSNADEIKLGKQLAELENEIKSMFLRTQNDISNLKKLEQVRTEFLGNVSHELRTPIFAIQGFIETLLDGALEDPKVNRNFLIKANQHTLNLNNLLNDLIDISMIESGQMKMSFRYFNIKDFLETIIEEMKTHSGKKEIELKLIPIKTGLQVYGDKERLKQVMTNLITNAVKYTETGTVEVGVIEEESKCKIYVRDTGIGLSEKDAARIFERFYRVDKDRSRAVGGTGLGLAIVKHIVDAHGSKTEVKSELGVGSEFSFYLKK